MKKPWIIGALLFLSLALNVTLGTMMMGRAIPNPNRPVELIMERIAVLPEPERAKAKAIFDRERPRIEAAIQVLQQSRIDTFGYIKSKDYQRDEAMRKMVDLREKTTAAQALGQVMVLDIADQLPQEHRKMLLKPE